MNKVAERPEEMMEHVSVEARLSEVGAKIDNLVARAIVTKHELREKLDVVKVKGGEALDELRTSLDIAWDEMNQAFAQIKEGTEKAAQKFR